MRVLIADDHTLVRAGVRRLLESFAGVEVIGEAREGQELLTLVEKTNPDAVLLDLQMPGMSGFEVAAELKRLHPGVAVIIISMHTEMSYVRQALDVGARCFVVKDAAPGELQLALLCAQEGRTFLSPQIAASMMNSMLKREVGGVDALSPRQREILKRLGRGQSSKEMAADLGISIKTVETHRARMMEVLGVKRANELLRFAVRHEGGFAA